MKKYFVIFILAIFAAGSIAFFVRDSIKNLVFTFFEERPPILEVSHAPISETEILLRETIIVPNGKEGEWDETIREPGNVVYKDGVYFLYYSGHTGTENPDTTGGEQPKIGVATSLDGKYWQKKGIALNLPSEDPFVILYQDTFYLFYEDKRLVPSTTVSVAISEDGLNFKLLKKDVLIPQKESWQDSDMGSQVVIHDGAKWVMLYEGRGKSSRGWVGYASSDDLINWQARPEPVFKGSYRWPWDMYLKWDNYVVPSDIIKNGDFYFMTVQFSGHKHFWQQGILKSTDLIRWEQVSDYPIHPSGTVMFSPGGVFSLAPEGLVNYQTLKAVEDDNRFYNRQL